MAIEQQSVHAFGKLLYAFVFREFAPGFKYSEGLTHDIAKIPFPEDAREYFVYRSDFELHRTTNCAESSVLVVYTEA